MNPNQNQRLGVVICKSMEQYVATILDSKELNWLPGEDVVPILADREEDSTVRFTVCTDVEYQNYHATQSLEGLRGLSVSAWLETCRTSSARLNISSDRVCVVIEDDPAALVGVVHALATDKHIVILKQDQNLEDLAMVLQGALSVTLVLSPAKCALLGVDRLRDYLAGSSNGIPRMWGIVTASTLSKLSNLVARIKHRSPPIVARGKIFRDHAFPISAANEPDLKEFTLPPHPSEEMQSLTQEATGLAVFVGHGRPYCAMGGNMCSLKEPVPPGSDKCVEGYQCVFPGWARIPAQDLRADAVFADSCSISSFCSPGPEGTSSINLGVSLLDGYSSAVIAPHRSNSPLLLSPYIVWSLLKQGLPMGQVCSTLNHIYSERLQSAEPFVLLGDPEIRIFGAPFPRPGLARVSDRGQQSWTLQCPTVGGVEIFECSDSSLVEAGKSSVLHCLPDRKHDPSVVVEALPISPGADSVQLLAVWSGEPDASEMNLAVISRPPFCEETIATAMGYLDNLRIGRNWLSGHRPGTAINDQAKLETDLISVLTSIERKVAVANSYPIMKAENYVEIFQAEHEIRLICQRLGRTMISNMVAVSKENGLWMYNHYTNSNGLRRVSDEPSAEPCPYCGGRVRSCNYQVGLCPTQERRLLECECCLFICDVESRSAPLLLKGPNQMRKGSNYAIILEVHNTLGVPVLVHAGLTIDRMGYPYTAFRVEPEIQEAEVRPGGIFQFSFAVSFSKELPSHLFHAKGLALINGAVLWALKKILVCEDSVSLEANSPHQTATAEL